MSIRELINKVIQDRLNNNKKIIDKIVMIKHSDYSFIELLEMISYIIADYEDLGLPLARDVIDELLPNMTMTLDQQSGLRYKTETYDNLIRFLQQDAQINRELATMVAKCNNNLFHISEDAMLKLLASFIPVYNELLKQKNSK